MSSPVDYSSPVMKLIKDWVRQNGAERVVARFGEATLVHLGGATYELRGGNAADAAAAREWTAHFLHEAVLPCRPTGFRSRF